MATVFRRYLDENDGQCPTNAHVLVNYSKQQTDLKTMKWIDAHLIIEHYMLHNEILPSDSDSDEDSDDSYSNHQNTNIINNNNNTDNSNNNNKNNNNNRIQNYLNHHVNNIKRSISHRMISYKTLNDIQDDNDDDDRVNNKEKSTLSRRETPFGIQQDPIISRQESNHFLFNAQSYPTRERRESQVTDPCFRVCDILILFCCTTITLCVGIFVLMIGINKYEYHKQYSIDGKCKCIDTNIDNKYQHKWIIYNNSFNYICNNYDSFINNKTFITTNDETIYEYGSIHDCFTNQQCDKFYVNNIDNHQSMGTIYLYSGSIVLIIGICCFIMTFLCYCKICKTSKFIHCQYCSDCLEYCSGKDATNFYDEQDDILRKQQKRLEYILSYQTRKCRIQLTQIEIDIISKYYHINKYDNNV